MKIKKIIINIVIHLSIIIAVIILFILNFEIYLRFTWKRKLQDQSWRTGIIYQEDDKLIYSLKPNSSRTHSNKEFKEIANINNLGFRQEGITLKNKKINTYRIITVGDSFTFGHGLNNNETYPFLLETELSSKSKNTNFEVLNAGVPGYGPDQEYELITNNLIQYDPDLIIWNLTSYDYYDMTSALPALFSIDNKGNLTTLDARMNWLYIQNKLLIYTPKIIKNTYLFDFLVSQLSHLSFLSRRPSFNTETLTNWSYTKLIKQIGEVDKISRTKRFKLLIARLPTKAEFNNDSQNVFNILFTNIKNYLEKNNISYIDISIEIKEINQNNFLSQDITNKRKILGVSKINTDELFYKYDGHPTNHGSVVISSILSNYIIDKIIVSR